MADEVLSWEEAVLELRNDPKNYDLVRDAYYDDPLVEACERYTVSSEWRAVQEMLVGLKGYALDIGAGRGIASFALAKEGFQVAALEPDNSSIVGGKAIENLAIETKLPIEVFGSVSEKLPFEDNTFDVVYARAVLHHMSDLELACREIHRVLKPGGSFIGAREHVLSTEDDLQTFLDGHPLHNLYGGEHAYLLEVYTNALSDAGLTLNKVLKPLKSALNYSPKTKPELIGEICSRIPIVSRFSWLFKLAPFSNMLLELASRLDNRPGRLYSFVAVKPPEG